MACVACRCIASCVPTMSREDSIAYGAICALVEATEHRMTLDDLCADHQHKLGLLRSVGTFNKPRFGAPG